jgi:hypothetical protein
MDRRSIDAESYGIYIAHMQSPELLVAFYIHIYIIDFTTEVQSRSRIVDFSGDGRPCSCVYACVYVKCPVTLKRGFRLEDSIVIGRT